MAQIARPEADKAADAARNARNEVAELGKQMTDKAAGQAENVARRRLPVRSSGGRCRGRGGAEDR